MREGGAMTCIFHDVYMVFVENHMTNCCHTALVTTGIYIKIDVHMFHALIL